MPSVELIALAGVVFYFATLIAWFVFGPGATMGRIMAVVLPLAGAAFVVVGILMLPNSMCGESLWMPCFYRAFQFGIAFSFLWSLGAWGRIAFHRNVRR